MNQFVVIKPNRYYEIMARVGDVITLQFDSDDGSRGWHMPPAPDFVEYKPEGHPKPDDVLKTIIYLTVKEPDTNSSRKAEMVWLTGTITGDGDKSKWTEKAIIVITV